MPEIRSAEVRLGGQTFHVRLAGEEGRPMLLFLHGFPEYSGAWEEILPPLSRRYLCVAPDQRGYGRSWRPEGVENYRVSALVGDAAGLIGRFAPEGRAAAVIGHDWGASVAYALAIRLPEIVDRLVILNGVHPALFQAALARGGAQAEASQYFHTLRREGSENYLSANGYEKLQNLFGAGMDMSWLTPERRADYVEAWGGPEGLRAMIDWYRATPIVVPEPGQALPPEALPKMDPAALRVHMPHLLLWGPGDRAFAPEAREGLDAYCDDLRVVEIEGCDHWIAHQAPERVCAEIEAFLAES